MGFDASTAHLVSIVGADTFSRSVRFAVAVFPINSSTVTRCHRNSNRRLGNRFPVDNYINDLSLHPVIRKSEFISISSW